MKMNLTQAESASTLIEFLWKLDVVDAGMWMEWMHKMDLRWAK